MNGIHNFSLILWHCGKMGSKKKGSKSCYKELAEGIKGSPVYKVLV